MILFNSKIRKKFSDEAMNFFLFHSVLMYVFFIKKIFLSIYIMDGELGIYNKNGGGEKYKPVFMKGGGSEKKIDKKKVK